MREHENSTACGSAVLGSNTCRPGLNRKTIARFFASVVFLVALAVGLGVSSMCAADAAAPLTKQQVKELIKTAKTPEDHMKLARYYRYEAAKLQAEANDHKEMAAEYYQNPQAHPGPKWPTLGQHCQDLSSYYAKAAKEAGEMASMHEEMAKAAEK